MASNHQKKHKNQKLMKKERLNCEKARNISIVKTLENLGHFSKKESEKEAWFLSPFRSETQASFKVDLKINRWYDHGENKGGNVIDLIMSLKNYSVPEALSFLSDDITSFSFHQQPKILETESTQEFEIIEIKNIEHQALIDYVESRSIPKEIAKVYCVEIYYMRNCKKYFSLGFINDNQGYELRNKYFKGCIGNKSITTIKNGGNEVVVFEGFMDFMTYKSIYNTKHLKEDYIICNSTALVQKIVPKLDKYKAVYVCFDNDESGRKATQYLRENHKTIIDCSMAYSGYKDLNEYLCKSDFLKKDIKSCAI